MDEETVVQQVEELDTLLPYEKPPKCTREAFLSPPDWRYQEAVAYLEAERNGRSETIPKDPIVHLLIRALRAYRNPNTRKYMRYLWPTVMYTIQLGTEMRNSAITAHIESHIIAGHTASSLKAHDSTIPTDIYNLYSKAFLDLTGVTAVHSWINDFLFTPEKYSGNTVLLRARIISYYGASELGMKSVITGMESKEAENLLRQTMQTERQREIFDYVLKATNMNQTDYALLMEGALKSMTERDFQEHMRDRLEAGSDSLVDLAANIADGVRAFSQHEMEHYNQNGIDPINGFTSIICNERASEDGR